MKPSHKLTQLFLSMAALFAVATMALAADPGLTIPATSGISDQKAGSVLFYNVYTSKIANPGAENTRINITNTNTFTSATIHLFFVDGSTCSPSDTYVCLTPNQTFGFNMSELDPDIMGYIVAVATDASGCPIQFNYLIGDESVKFASGHHANLGAEAIAAIAAPAGCDANSVTATLAFDGVNYNLLPRVLAVDHVQSIADGNNTLLILNRVGGSLLTGASSIGSVFGLLFDANEKEYSFTFSGGCQLKSSLSNAFPRTAPRFTTVVPKGGAGYMKFWATSDVAMLGAVLNYNPASATDQNAHTGGHNLHKLTYSSSANYIIPVFGASCAR